MFLVAAGGGFGLAAGTLTFCAACVAFRMVVDLVRLSRTGEGWAMIASLSAGLIVILVALALVLD